MNNQDIINVDILKQIQSLLEQEYRKFETSTYNIFTSSYLKNNSDVYIKIMSNNLEKIYIDIDRSYKNIIEWLNKYINDIYSVESYLSEESRLGTISESVIRNYMDSKIHSLPKYNAEFGDIFNRKSDINE